ARCADHFPRASRDCDRGAAWLVPRSSSTATGRSSRTPAMCTSPARSSYSGAAQAIRQLNEHGFLVVVVSNQSGIGRGLYTVADYTAVQRRLTELLEAHGAHLDGAYFCPHHPRFTGPCECRKPGVKLFRDAAQDLDIDFTRSWWVGDRLSDVQPAAALGGKAI